MHGDQHAQQRDVGGCKGDAVAPCKAVKITTRKGNKPFEPKSLLIPEQTDINWPRVSLGWSLSENSKALGEAFGDNKHTYLRRPLL